MFGIAPLLRGLLALTEVAAVVLVVFGMLALLLRLFGIDVRDVRHYQQRRQAYDLGLRRLHENIARAESDAELLDAAALLRDYQSQKPAPPSWAFWLKASS